MANKLRQDAEQLIVTRNRYMLLKDVSRKHFSSDTTGNRGTSASSSASSFSIPRRRNYAVSDRFLSQPRRR
jgi:hypothetical protein